MLIPLRRSAILLSILLLAHGCAAVIVIILALPLWVKTIILLGCALSAVFYIGRDALYLFPSSVRSIKIADDLLCTLENNQGVMRDYSLLGTSYVSPWLVVLNLKPEHGRFLKYLIIVPDGIGVNDFRELRVILKWKTV